MACIAVVLCLLLVVVVAAPKKKKPSALSGRIVGGTDTDIIDVSYQVSLQFNGKHDCGGSIIGPKYILTAAHCVRDGTPSNYSVRAGSKDHARGGKIRKVKKIISHPEYDIQTADYDIALLELEKALPSKENIKVIGLVDKEPKVGDQVLVSGWGAHGENGASERNLSSVTVPVFNKETCKQIHDKFTVVTDNMFCAGYAEGGKDACHGDSGGPAVVGKHLAGVISWGNGCAKENTPGVYTSIAKFREWIESMSKD